jgi:hypothetical protein
MQLVQTLSDALARTRDAAQFQVQTEVALLTACDVEALTPAPAPVRTVPTPAPAPPPPVDEHVALATAEPTPPEETVSEETVAEDTVIEETVILVDTPPPTPPLSNDTTLHTRWPDVVEQVQRRSPLLAAFVSSAQPLTLDDSVLTVAFSTDHNRKSAERANHRQVIEAAFQRVYGAPYRLRAVVASETGSLLDDPVINFAQRTFGGQPKRVPTE